MATLLVNDLNPRVQYTATSSQTVFAYGFSIFNDSDLKVYVGSTVKTLTTDYTVSGAGTTAGGNVTFGTGLTSGDIVTIYRDLPVSRTTDYQANGDLLAESLNDDLDKLAMMIQQVEYDLNSRTLRFGQFTTGIPLSEFTEDATDRAGKVLSFDSSGDPTITQELGTYQGTDATTTTAAYSIRDIVKSTTTAQLNNIYICTATSPSGTALTNTSYWALIIDAVAAGSSATAAASSASAAATSETNAATSATNAATSETNAATSATSASTAKTNAETAETNAETAETNAEAAVGAVAWKYTFDSSTTMADPGTGDIRLDNATVASVTNLAFDAVSADTGNPDISDFIASIDDGTNDTHEGFITIRKSGTPATFAVFSVTGTITDNTGWLQVPVTHVASNGTLSGSLYVSFTRSGGLGATGSTGATGPTGATGATGATGGGLADVVDDTTPQLGGDLDCNGAQIQWSKGADVASATALPVLTDGNYFDVTGTTTVTSINTTGGAGTLIKLHFDAILILTHHATDLILPGGANITTAAGDEAEFIEYDTGDYRCTNYSKADGTSVVAAGGGKVLQVVQTVLGEGNNLQSFNPSSYTTAQAITNATISYTPLSTTSKLLVMNDTYFYTNNSGNQSWFYIRLSLMYNYSTSAPTSPTALFQRPNVFSHDWSSSTNGVWFRNSSSMSYLHDHNTPSGESITYKMYWDTSSGASTATFDTMRLNKSSNMGTFTIIEVET